MGKEDVAQALDIIASDNDKRKRAGHGHLGDLEDAGLQFSREEKSLLKAAAKNFPHDSGFAYANFLQSFNNAADEGGREAAINGTESPEFNAALRYAAMGELTVLNEGQTER